MQLEMERNPGDTRLNHGRLAGIYVDDMYIGIRRLLQVRLPLT
jgi:hypothetical protein